MVSRADDIARRLEFPVLLFIVVALPWEFTKTWFPTQLLEVSRLGILVAIAILASHLAAGTFRLPRSPLLIAIGAVVAVVALSAAVTRWENGVKDAVAVVVYACLALFIAHVLDRRSRVRWFGAALVVSAVIVAGIGIGQEIGGFYLWQAEGNEVLGRRNSTFGDPNVAARFLAIALVTCFAVVAGLRLRPKATVAVLVAVGMLAVAQVLTLSRMGWVLAVVSVALWIPLAVSHQRLRLALATYIDVFASYVLVAPTVLHRAGTAAADAVIRTGIGGPVTAPPTGAGPRAVAGTPLDGLIVSLPIDSVRRYLVRAGVAMTFDHPLFGVGLGGYQPQILTTYWDYVPKDRRASPTTLIHTDSIRVLAETGVVGFAAFVGLLVAAAAAVLRAVRDGPPSRRIAGWAAGSAVLLILLSSQFAGRFFNEPYLWLSIGVLMAAGWRDRWLQPEPSRA
jgi:O-antigen ligase